MSLLDELTSLIRGWHSEGLSPRDCAIKTADHLNDKFGEGGAKKYAAASSRAWAIVRGEAA